MNRSRILAQFRLLLLLPGLAAGTARGLPPPQEAVSAAADEGISNTVMQSPGTLLIMSLNLAHGRGTGIHQILTGTGTIKNNLQRIASVIRREGVNVVALQEADGPSFWSGNFNHVEFLLRNAGMDSAYQGFHVRGIGLQYGTSILADTGIVDTASARLSRSPLTLPKGFVVSTIAMPGARGSRLDLVSVHLDFLSSENRRRQAEVLVAELEGRSNPLILMGDFNSDWKGPDSVLRYLSRELALTTWQPEREDLVTYPRTGGRIDWILVTRPLQIRNLKVLPDTLSDHRALVAEIQFEGV